LAELDIPKMPLFVIVPALAIRSVAAPALPSRAKVVEGATVRLSMVAVPLMLTEVEAVAVLTMPKLCALGVRVCAPPRR
jgi:hypothetical protein